MRNEDLPIFEYIDDEKSLKDTCRKLKNYDILGIDIECENNLHHYGSYISLIQISSINKNWIIDVLKLKNIDCLLRIFNNRNIKKIFHGISFDIRILHDQFDCKIKNIFDTQTAALLIGKKDIGLGSLMEEYFSIEKKSKFQMADWTKRPIRENMLNYAIKDSIYLIKLHEILIKELIKLNRIEWANEEFILLESEDLTTKKASFWDVKGISLLTDKERAIVKRLFILREKMAKKANRPVHFIMNNKKMKSFAVKPFKIDQWKKVTEVHPIVKRYAKIFFEEVNKGKNEKIYLPKLTKRLFYNQEQKNILNNLTDKRIELSKKLDIEKYIIINKDQIKDIVLSKNFNSLKNWQKKLFENFSLK